MSIRLINGVLLTLAMMTLSCVDDAEIQRPQDPALEDTEFLGRVDAVNRGWNIGEKVLVYDGVSPEPAEYVTTRLDSDGNCILEGKVFNTSEHYVALYPSSAFEGMSDGNAVYKVPAMQILPHADSSRAEAPSAAVAMSHLKEFDFVSVVSYLAFDITAEGVEAFTVKAKGNATLAGTVTVSVNDGTVVTSDGEESVSLVAFEGSFKPGRYYVQIMPGTYNEGFTVDVDMEADKTMSFEIDSMDIRTGRIAYAGNISSPIDKPEVTVSQVAFTTATLSWTRGDKVQEYNVYVNGTKVRTLDRGIRTCKVTGLKTGAENSVEVEAVSAFGSEKTEVKVKTAGVYEYEKSTGTSFLCIGWDPPARTEIHGTTQAYQIQVWADELMTTPIYDFVPEPGGNNTQSQLFGNGSYYGYTQAPQGPDGVKSSNYLTPTRVSVGGFYPNSTYYVRVRTLASYTQANGTVLSHPFGDSEWSDLIPMSTDPVHVPAENEIIYGGFNDMCVQTDFLNSCLGAKNATSGSAIAWDKRSAQLFYFYVNNHGQHQANTFGLASNGVRIDGTTTLVEGCAILKGNAAGTGNAYIGDMKDWVWAAWTRPVMGAYALDGTGTFIDTPALTSEKLSSEGTECTLTFKASLKIRITDEYNPDAAAVAVKVWRSGADIPAYETVAEFKTSEILPFDVTKDTSKEVLNDYGRNELSCSMILYPGDIVEIASMRTGYIILDDILVVKK